MRDMISAKIGGNHLKGETRTISKRFVETLFIIERRDYEG